MMEDIKVLLVEDHTMTRMGLAFALEKAQGISLIGEAVNGIQGVELAQKFIPNVILMDIGLPEIDGIEATKRIKNAGLNSKILIFTSRESEEDVFAAFKSGADGYIMKGANPEQTVSAIKAVNDGVGWLDANIAKLVLSNIQKITPDNFSQAQSDTSDKTFKNIYGLTERELEVLVLIVEGLSNPQIADRLVITRATAKAHVHSILQKLSVANRAQAAVYAMNEGLV